MSFTHLDLPASWHTHFTKYPHGYTIFEALSNCFSTVNELIDFVNVYFDEDIEYFVEQILLAWASDGSLDTFISNAILNIGDRQYTEQNYVANDETLTASVDSLDQAFNNYVKISNMPLNVKDFGAIGDGVIDDTTAFINAIASTQSNIIEIPVGDYKISSDIIIDRDIIINGNNAQLIMINNSGFFCNGDITDIGVTFTTPAVKGDLSIELSNTAGISNDDVLILTDEADNSFSPYRTYYKDGEIVEISGITGNTVTLKSQLETNYNITTCKVYKMSPIKVIINNLKITKPDLNTGDSLYLYDTINSELNNVKLENNNSNDCLFIARCYNLTIRKTSAINNSTDISQNGYGMVIRGSQNVNIYDSYFMARRHASAVGAGGIYPTQTNRHIVFYNCIFKSFSTENNTHAADFHGAIEFGYYHNCTMYGGVVLGGKNVGCYDSVIYDKGNQGGLYFREIPSGVVDYRNIKYYGKNLPVAIHSSDEMNKVNGDISFNYENIDFNLSSTPTVLFNLTISSTNNSKLNVHIKNINSNVTPTEQFIFFFGTIIIGKVTVEDINTPSLVERWYRISNVTADNNTSLTLPPVNVSGTLTFTGSGNVVVYLPVRMKHKNISGYVQPMMGLYGVTLNLGSWSADGNGYYYWSRVYGFDNNNQGALTIPFIVTILTENVNPDWS